uniref:Uncharacterized protein n=1 Tax=Nymphaea colorata TaxID=210225 RepID=A0A5K1E216_9MAGN
MAALKNPTFQSSIEIAKREILEGPNLRFFTIAGFLMKHRAIPIKKMINAAGIRGRVFRSSCPDSELLVLLLEVLGPLQQPEPEPEPEPVTRMMKHRENRARRRPSNPRNGRGDSDFPVETFWEKRIYFTAEKAKERPCAS